MIDARRFHITSSVDHERSTGATSGSSSPSGPQETSSTKSGVLPGVEAAERVRREHRPRELRPRGLLDAVERYRRLHVALHVRRLRRVGEVGEAVADLLDHFADDTVRA
jgi:hypothetical protein